MTRSAAVLVVCTACWLLAVPARAELVFFSSGQALSVRGHRDDGARTVLMLKNGGEIVCDASIIVRIAPDEVPDPDPASAPAADDPLSVLESSYAEIIDRMSAAYGVNPQLVRAVIRTESAYRTDAVSRKGAMGLMQLMPGTARRYAVANPFDPEANVGAGVRHLRGLLDRFDVAQALAAYNAGEEAVERFQGIPPYRETQDYVRRVLTLAGLVPFR